MEYIDKTNEFYRDECKQITDRHLEGSWNEDEERYYNSTYNSDFRIKIIAPLIREQNGKCCYCMRSIDQSQATIEHIIPQNKCTSDDLKYYQSTYDVLSCRNIKYLEDDCLSKLNYPPYPHTIAYENLTVSCNGILGQSKCSKCCNNPRGNKRFIPLMYIENINSIIKYTKSGIIYSDNNELYGNTIDLLNLNDETLVEVRAFWAIVSNEIESTIEVTKPILIDILEKNSQLSSKYEKFWDVDLYFKLFKEYCWFRDYYTNR